MNSTSARRRALRVKSRLWRFISEIRFSSRASMLISLAIEMLMISFFFSYSS